MSRSLVKPQLLKMLLDSRGVYISGVVLARELSVSRNAIWKTVESLRVDGYRISAVTNKGYRLEAGADILSEAGIIGKIRTEGVFCVDVRKTATSTNAVLREMAANGAPEGLVLATEEQTEGKGRLGRSFHSPAGHGVYFSLLLRPGNGAFRIGDRGRRPGDAALITSAAGVAAARAIEEVTGVRVGIKWVNDLFHGGKKVCGILTEAEFSMESGMIESAVLGIGINVTRPGTGFPKELETVAGAISDRVEGRDGERCHIIASTLDNFWRFYINLSGREFLDEYRERSVVLGRDIFVLSGGGQRLARALEIDDDCGLLVRFENGEVTTLNSGEVSVKQL